jgi:hypothetical protein
MKIEEPFDVIVVGGGSGLAATTRLIASSSPQPLC